MEKLLVIGASSFAGQDFVRAALESGKYQVFCQSRTFKQSFFIGYDQTKVTHIYCDLNKSTDGFLESIDRIQPDYIVNFAAQSEVPFSWDNPDHWYTTNCVFVAKLAKFLSNKTWLKKYLHVSSPELYGSQEREVNENCAPNPSTPYAASKLAGDTCLQLYYRQFGLPALFIRAANYIGARQQIFKITPRSILWMLQGKKIPLHGGGTSQRAFTDISDVSKGELLLLERGVPGEVYHLANHEMTSVIDIASMVYLELKERGKIFGFLEDHIEDVAQRPGNDKAYVLNCDKIKSLGWVSEISVRQSINQTIDWVLTNYAEIEKLPLTYQHKP